ncbi:MAG: ATP-binding protein [Armatimonadota bacterium]
MYPRKLCLLLKKHISKKQISVITGMRRTGKTTILKQLLSDIPSENKIYIDLERIDNRELFSEKNYDAVIYTLRQRGLDIKKKAYIALDEIQLMHNLPSVLKYLYDNYDIKFLVTGSSSYYLKNLFTESLAGRKKIFELYSLDFGEFLTFKEVSYVSENFLDKKFNPYEYERLKKYYEEYIEYGGFPEVVLSDAPEDKKDLLLDIINSYIDIDVKTLADFRNQDNLYKLIKMLAGRSCTRLDYSKLSKLVGISRPTVHTYVDFFEKTYLISRLSVLANNPDREIVKAQKIYFCDNGIMNVLFDTSSGVKFENAIFTQLYQRGSLSYYSLKTGREIDFILNKDMALEAKESPISSDLESLNKISSQAGVKNFRLIGRRQVPNFDNYIWGGEIN